MDILMYFLKSAACLAVLLLFYKLLLEKENLPVFKRFYLLGSLLISFLIPLITFTHFEFYTPVENVDQKIFTETLNLSPPVEQEKQKETVDYGP